MPRGSPGVWNHHGASYHELSQATRATSSASASSSRPDASKLPPAGAPSNMPVVGAMSFIAAKSTSMQLGEPGRKLSSATELRSQYQPAPDNHPRTRPVPPPECSIPRPNYAPPSESFRTVKQTDHPPGLLARSERAQLCMHRDNGRLVLQDVKPVYETSKAVQFPTRSRQEVVAANSRPAGLPATQRTGNIITGGPALTNNAFEHHQRGQDYRRHR